MMWLFLIFVGVPILEIALFIQVGGAIGIWATLAIVVLTALAGTTLMRIQGMQALSKLQRSVEQGGNPVGPIAHGALILVAGVLLLTPGFFTDAVGLALLIPPVRDFLIRYGASKITVQAATFVNARGSNGPPAADAIDAEYEIIDDPVERAPGRNNQP
jgi:UPF0716 protein FxsA